MAKNENIDGITEDIREVVTYKVKKRVAKKVMRDIQRQADEIEDQVNKEKKFRNYLLPVIVILLIFIAMIVLGQY